MSRRWAEILTSRPTWNYLLRAWYQEDEFVTNVLEPSVASAMAEHIDAYCAGTPFSRLFLDLDPMNHLVSGHCYSEGIIAWSNPDLSVEYLCIAIGERDILRVPERELFTMALSSSTLVILVVESGKTYIWSLPITPQSHPKIVQLKSTLGTRVAVAGQTVVTFQGWQAGLKTRSATVFEMDTGATSYFEMPIQGAPRSMALLDYNGQSIFLFDCNADIEESTGDRNFWFAQYNLQVRHSFGLMKRIILQTRDIFQDFRIVLQGLVITVLRRALQCTMKKHGSGRPTRKVFRY